MKDMSVSITIEPDRMKAYITLSPPDNGRSLTNEEVMEILNRNGVLFGIDAERIDSLLFDPVYEQMLPVASGNPPVSGQNGKVEFLFDIRRESKPTILEDGRVDYRELNLIESVTQGQILCRLIDPVPGIPGTNVSGTELPALNGKPAALPKGRNVIISEDGQGLLAGLSGQVNFIDGKVNVFATYEVAADVDNSVGNISFVGNVIIRGNVLSGFIVEAGGSVEVWGVAEGAVIKAGGDIILRRGMQGMGKGTLISGGDVIARYIDNGTVEAKGSIKAEAVMHSSVKCGGKLELSGKKGLLVGGVCKVGKEISAKVIGSHLATLTDVEVGVDPAVRERYKSLKEEVSEMEADLRKAEQAIILLKKLEGAGQLSAEKQEIMTKSIRTRAHIANSINDLREEMSVLESRLQQDSTGKIRCQNCIYPGTKVVIGSCQMLVKENLQYCTLYRSGADIRVGAIDR